MADPADGLPMPRRGYAAAAIWLSMAITVLDTPIANVALPVIVGDFASTPTATLWIVQAYQMAIVTSLLVWSALGDRSGYRGVYLTGLTVFTLASLGCAMAPNLWALVAARFVQGLGAAAIMGVNGALVRLTFPAKRQGRAFGLNALVISVSATAGPVLAGAILSVLSWRWLFGINLVFGGAALVAGVKALPSGRGALERVDWCSGALYGLTMACLFGAAVMAASGRRAMPIGATLVISFGLAWWLRFRARNDARPLVPFDLISTPVLRSAYLASFGSFAAQASVLVALPFYLHSAHGFDALFTGLIMAILPLGLVLSALLAGRFADLGTEIDKFGLPLAGLALLGMALVAGNWSFGIAMCAGLAGVGFGLFQAPNNRRMIAGTPRWRSGAAAGMLAVVRLSGQTTGVVAAMVVMRNFGAASLTFAAVSGGFAIAGGLFALCGSTFTPSK
jgi:DHA2 family multidrug resistance protein-like MFS transporter